MGRQLGNRGIRLPLVPMRGDVCVRWLALPLVGACLSVVTFACFDFILCSRGLKGRLAR